MEGANLEMYTETLSISFKGMGYQQVAEWVYIINLDCIHLNWTWRTCRKVLSQIKSTVHVPVVGYWALSIGAPGYPSICSSWWLYQVFLVSLDRMICVVDCKVALSREFTYKYMYILVMLGFWVEYHGISHKSLVFSGIHTWAFRWVCIP